MTATELPSTEPAEDRTGRYCVIGAGAAGLAAAKSLLEVGLDVDVIERERAIGGVWNPGSARSPAYRSLHLITSKRWIEFPDFPIPDRFPTFLGLYDAHEYLTSYARWSGVDERIELGRSVEGVTRADGTWRVTLDGGETRRYGGLVIANGHNAEPFRPEFPGEFHGTTMHAADYFEPSIFDGRRVLVIGGGTSGADIAVESAGRAQATFLSVRRGCYYWPKYVLGMPVDDFYEGILRFRMPRSFVRMGARLILRASSAGNPQSYGLPKPPHRILDEHFVINSTLLYNLGHGRIGPRPGIASLDGDGVRFTDGTREEVDLIVCATGYQQTHIPFIDPVHLNWKDRIPQLHLHMFHPEHDNLFVIGLFQTGTGNWQIMHYQAQAMARYVHWMRHDPERVAAVRREKESPRFGRALSGGLRFYDSNRHLLQVDHVTLRGELRRLLRRLPAPSSRRTSRKPVAV
ncbi:flavin-containing monooxygenase [Antribacter gilvus]|uniref:flavin-containing monooxygenase n=1 Tax=Antribacter gilvus TaxID=2304675 RepID=UPI000F78B8D8|nr:NAD(P)-binding domain-containing protein [Antribacter gilvus]